MRCRNCDYPLWNLKVRQCPECGVAFLPSEFDFVPNRVRFCCLECEQPYYGTDARGHLEPREFDCVSCGAPVRMDQMVLRPGEGVQDEQTKPDRMPWLERATRGRIKAWIATIGMALVQPGRLMKATPSGEGSGQGWWFAIINAIAVLLIGLSPIFLLPAIIAIAPGGMTGSGSGPGTAAVVAGVAGVIGGVFVGWIVFTLLYMVLWGLSAHAVLRVTGGTSGDLARTFQAICYSSGANIVTAVPCFGKYFGWIWWVVSAVLMLKDGHRVHGGRATAAGLAFPILMMTVVVGLSAWMMAVSISAAGTAQATALATSTQAETLVLAEGIQAHALDGDGQGPGHALVLAAEERFGPGSFIGMSTMTTQSDVPVLEEITLAQFREQGPNRQADTAGRAAALLPDGVIAYRVGDFVLTYHGIDFSFADPGLWTVIASPDPDADLLIDGIGGQHCGCVDGSVEFVPATTWLEALVAQNDLRAAHGLSPLPDPATITHAAPAVAPPRDAGDAGGSP